MIPVLEVESCNNKLATRKSNFTNQLPVSTEIQTFNDEILEKDFSYSNRGAQTKYFSCYNQRNIAELQSMAVHSKSLRLKTRFPFQAAVRACSLYAT